MPKMSGKNKSIKKGSQTPSKQTVKSPAKEKKSKTASEETNANSVNAVNPANDQIVMQQEITITSLNLRIEELEAKLSKLEAMEGRVNKLEAGLIVSKRVSELLERQLDEQQAYSRRPCVVVAGIKKVGDDRDVFTKTRSVLEEAVSADDFNWNVDKLHRIGQVDKKTNTQPIIVKFKSHSFKERVYRSRKLITNKNIFIRPSITKRRLDLLNETKTFIRENPGCGAKFTMANMHGDLKILIKKGEIGTFHSFNSFQDFIDVISQQNLSVVNTTEEA